MKATFAAGCFWGVETAFRKISGVKTRVGYMGGHTKNPTYKDVCKDLTGHAEAVEITFNPHKVSYSSLLKTFWMCHDPTQLNAQGVDVGSQYRSVIFYHTMAQKNEALASRKKIQHVQRKKVVTKIEKATEFYQAESYHQQCNNKNFLRRLCRI